MDIKNIQKWYAQKCNKTVEEFDDFDLYVATVLHTYVTEEVGDDLVECGNCGDNVKMIVTDLICPHCYC